jgi:aminoglycoside phosphotransferase (APT) family kinase protein
VVSDLGDPLVMGPRLTAWAQRTFGGAVSVAEGPTPITGGYDTFIHGFRLRGPVEGVAAGPLILRLYPSAERGPSALREAKILRYLTSVDYPAPRPLEASDRTEDFGAPYVVMERVPGRTVLDLASARPRQAMTYLDELAEAQARLHQIDPAGWPVPPPEGAGAWEVDRRLADASAGGPPPNEELGRALAWLTANREVAQGHGPSLCHFDFHPVNALRDDGGRLSIIDWEGAGLGDRHSDLAHTLVLFEYAPAVAGKRIERVVLKAFRRRLADRYRQAYARHLPVEDDRLRYWMALHAARLWAEAVQLLDGTFERQTRTDLRMGLARAAAPAMAKLFHRLVPDA